MQEDNNETNTEIENILNENPLIEDKKSNGASNIKGTIKGKKKLKLSKKKVYLIVGVIIIILIGLAMLSSLSGNCEGTTTNTMSEVDFIKILRQQIIENGYAEMGEGDLKIKVSPYLE